MDNQILTLMVYIKPQIEILKAEFILLSSSGPEATSIGSPDVDNECKSIWDEDIENNETIDYEI